MTDTQTTLSEFGDEAETSDAPTPVQNAENINELVECVGTLNDSVATIAARLKQSEESPGVQPRNTNPNGMFQ